MKAKILFMSFLLLLMLASAPVGFRIITTVRTVDVPYSSSAVVKISITSPERLGYATISTDRQCVLDRPITLVDDINFLRCSLPIGEQRIKIDGTFYDVMGGNVYTDTQYVTISVTGTRIFMPVIWR